MFPAHLIDGYSSFRANRFAQEHQRYARLAEAGQQPQTMVISCCDSRVAPEVIFDAGPGELFVVRNVANLVPPFETNGAFHGTSAAVEFAVEVLRVRDIIILGHERCGGIRAYVEKQAPLSAGDFISKWINLVAPAADMIDAACKADADRYAARLEHAAISQSIANLMTFGIVRRRVEAGELSLHGAYFGIGSGELLFLDPVTKTFGPVTGLQERTRRKV